MTRSLDAAEHLEAAARAQREFGLCDACLGRRFAKVETGLTNPQRGERVRAASGLPPVDPAACFVCEGLTAELDTLAQVAAAALAPYEHASFLVGTRFDPALEAREAEASKALGVEATAERINSEMNREIGKRVVAITGKDVDIKRPDLAVVVDTRFFDADLQFGSLFLFGRYRKLSRELPQTKWPCRRCQGTGCVRCDGTGKLYATSVEEEVAAPFIEASGATEESFHGAGREDIDARCIGEGRPFVLELKDPRRRSIDLAPLGEQVAVRSGGRVEVHGLRWSTKEEVVAVKEHRGDKTYLAKVRFAQPVAAETLLKAVSSLRGRAIRQRTPERVQHRRADLVRERTVLDIDIEEAGESGCVLRIQGDAGLYIKELVSGDEGRTEPSLAALVDTEAVVEELDIVAVQYEPPAQATAAHQP